MQHCTLCMSSLSDTAVWSLGVSTDELNDVCLMEETCWRCRAGAPGPGLGTTDLTFNSTMYKIFLWWIEEIDPATVFSFYRSMAHCQGLSVAEIRLRTQRRWLRCHSRGWLSSLCISVFSIFVDYPWCSALFCPWDSAVNSVAEDAQKVSHGACGVRRGRPAAFNPITATQITAADASPTVSV